MANKLRRILALQGGNPTGIFTGGIRPAFIFEHIGTFCEIREEELCGSILYGLILTHSFFPLGTGELIHGFKTGSTQILHCHKFKVPVGGDH